jgi:hypothetical protein
MFSLRALDKIGEIEGVLIFPSERGHAWCLELAPEREKGVELSQLWGIKEGLLVSSHTRCEESKILGPFGHMQVG